MEIHFFNAPGLLRSRTALKKFLVRQYAKQKLSRKGLNIIFCTDNELLKINNSFLNHDFFTDIITFDYPTDLESYSEIYISIERVRENAKQLNQPIYQELHRVIFHGVLHIFGFKDKTPSDKQKMTSAENKLLQNYF